MAGDPAALSHVAGLYQVSIRARHRWRAIQPVADGEYRHRAVSIRARHRWRAIQQQAGAAYDRSVFQSAPAIDGGRSSARASPGTSTRTFQSAPAIDGGRSLNIQHPCMGVVLVSIRARHRWRAIPLLALCTWVIQPFQSAPAIDGGRSRPGQ